MPTPREPGPYSEVIVQWKAIQNDLRQRLIVAPLKEVPRFVAGADAAYSADKQRVFAAALVYDRVEQRVLEVRHVTQKVEAPYIPGYLSFREGPPVIEALRQLRHEYGLIMLDGQGYAHPRRCGFACYVSITLDRPGVGVGKSRLIGTFSEPATKAGADSPLMDKTEQIGLVLRTKEKCRPLFVSVGHRVDLSSAKEAVLACCTKYRVPEPTRQADMEVAKLKAKAGGA